MAAVTITCSMVIVSPIVELVVATRREGRWFLFLFFNALPTVFLAADHHRRGLPGAHETPAFKLHVQPVPVRALQGGRHLPVWRGGQPVPDRFGEVHHRPPPSELLVRVRPEVLQGIRAGYQLHRQPAQCDGVQVRGNGSATRSVSSELVYTRHCN